MKENVVMAQHPTKVGSVAFNPQLKLSNIRSESQQVCTRLTGPDSSAFLTKALISFLTLSVSFEDENLWLMWFCETPDTYWGPDRDPYKALQRMEADVSQDESICSWQSLSSFLLAKSNHLST